MAKQQGPVIVLESCDCMVDHGIPYRCDKHKLPRMPSELRLTLRWHGIKRLPAPEGHRLIPTADLYIDCRGVAEEGIPGVVGTSPAFQAGIKKASHLSLEAMLDLITDSLRHIRRRRMEDPDPYKKPYEVLFMCAHGQQRSPSSCLVVAGKLRELGYEVETPQVKS